MRVRMGGEGTWLDWEIRVELPIRLDQVRAFGIYHFTVHSLADFVVRPKVGQQHTVMGDQQFLLTHNGTTLVPAKDILRLLQQGGVTKDLLALFALFCYGPLALHMCVSVSGGMSGTRGYVRGMSGGWMCVSYTQTHTFSSALRSIRSSLALTAVRSSSLEKPLPNTVHGTVDLRRPDLESYSLLRSSHLDKKFPRKAFNTTCRIRTCKCCVCGVNARVCVSNNTFHLPLVPTPW